MRGPNAGKSPVLDAAEEYVARPVLRTAKNAVAGVVGASDIIGNPMRDFISRGLDLAGYGDAANTVSTAPTAHDATAQAVDAATGGLTKPRNVHEKIADTGTEILTPGGPVTKAVTTAYKTAKATTPAARTAEDLHQMYLNGREALKQVEIPAEKVQKELLEPVAEALKYENPARHGVEVANVIDELKQFGRQGVNANFLEGFRQDLAKLPVKFREPIRKAMDEFYEKAELPSEFRSAYAVMKRGEALEDALTKAGDSLVKQRNAINTFLVKQKGLTDYERQVLQAAGKETTTEGLLKKAGTLSKVFGYISAFANLPVGVTSAVGGEALKAAANKLATRRIDKALKTVKGSSLEDLK